MTEEKEIHNHHIRVVKSSRETVAESVVMLIMAGGLYLAMNPEVADEINRTVNRWKATVIHRLSVWQTLISIRSLPQRDKE